MYRKKRSKTSVRTDSPRNVPSAALELSKLKKMCIGRFWGGPGRRCHAAEKGMKKV